MRITFNIKRMTGRFAALIGLVVLAGTYQPNVSYASFHAGEWQNPVDVAGFYDGAFLAVAQADDMTMDETDSGSAMPPEGSMGNMMRPAMAPPPGVFGATTPPKGKLMLSLSSSYMKMQGNRSGASDVSQDQVLADFMVAPLRMDVGMTMGMAMYGITDEWSVLGGASYIRKAMDHRNRAGTKFTTRSQGIGDPRIGTTYKFYQSGSGSLTAGVALSIPLGSIEEKDNTPADPTGSNPLPYPMQLGSGTWDAIPSLSYTGTTQSYTWGTQVAATLRPGRNNNGYRLGNIVEASLWGSRDLTDWVAVFGRVQGKIVGNIDGRDPQISTTLAPTGDPNRRGQRVVNLSAGMNAMIGRATQLALEATAPIYQNLDGPQLETDFAVTAKISLAF